MSFKTCGACGGEWENRNAFLSDPQLEVAGYQANFQQLEMGLFLFSHMAPDCGTTLAVRSGEFTDLYHGTIWQERRTGAADCPGYCLHKTELRACAAKCECAYVREVIEIVRTWPKQGGKAA